ncbi:MAG: UDP-N-acetylmuramoyl-L-alanine--D-glutamate ligase [bacterium]
MCLVIKMLEDLKDKKILILGFGKEGRDSYLALRKLFPGKVLGVADRDRFKIQDSRDKNLKLYLGENYLDKIGEYDLVIKTPGISLEKRPNFTSQTEIFFDNFPGIIVGVTGTKGKGTTASLIYEILKKAGLKVYLGGNIGKPVFQKLVTLRQAQGGPEDIFVYELSSHQLQGLKKSPQIAVFLNLFSDHLDYYKNFAEYQKAKANIAKYQTKDDYLIFNAKDKQVKEISKKVKSHKIDFNQDKKYYETRLPGEFNQLNIKAAVAVARLFMVKPEIIKTAMKDFKGLPHRLEFVGKFKGIEFYNNSMATVPQTTILDLQTFNHKPISLIAGGSDKGSDYRDLVKEIKQTSVKNLIVLGQGTGQRIEKALKLSEPRAPKNLSKEPGSPGLRQLFHASSMKEAVRICYENTPKNGVCLLSPASASFNLFKDYQDRGKQFVKYAKLYGAKKT